MLAYRNKYKFTLDLPRDLVTIVQKMDKLDFKIGQAVSYLKLLHKDTQIKVENPLKLHN